ncbi:hypothetical protein LTR64_003971 [Lithohypha guttulata]|uniref:uncharacterized protein n=1 Tax=Lithohypha guttulata TaxID=1690604 RepID=UPI002DE14AF9|nr:hypothetical protein LTR51_007009 [Lithohypha guttulata]
MSDSRAPKNTDAMSGHDILESQSSWKTPEQVAASGQESKDLNATANSQQQHILVTEVLPTHPSQDKKVKVSSITNFETVSAAFYKRHIQTPQATGQPDRAAFRRRSTINLADGVLRFNETCGQMSQVSDGSICYQHNVFANDHQCSCGTKKRRKEGKDSE